MKGFIEITYIDDVNKKSLKMLINIRNIMRISVANSTYYKTEIELTSDKGYLAVETYEEIKQKIKEATEPRLMIDEKGNFKEMNNE